MCELFFFKCRIRRSEVKLAVLARQSEAGSRTPFYHCMQSRTLQQYEDNPLSLSVCQDTNLPWFPAAAACTTARVTESKMCIDQLQPGIKEDDKV